MAYSHELPPFFCLLFFWGCPGIPQVSWKLYVLTQDEGLPTLLRRAFNVSPHKFGVVFLGVHDAAFSIRIYLHRGVNGN